MWNVVDEVNEEEDVNDEDIEDEIKCDVSVDDYNVIDF